MNRRFRQDLLAAVAVIALSVPLQVQAADPVALFTGDVPNGALEPLLEQPMPPALPATTPAPIEADDDEALGPQPSKVELAALYYYAEQKEQARLEAETQRLKAKYPGFVVPRDVFLPPAQRGMNEQALWSLYDANDFAGIEAEIARMKERTPGWLPSDDFMTKLERKKLRFGIEQAASMRDWTTVAALGQRIDARTETEVDLLWTLIDAHAESGNKEAAATIYRGILNRVDHRVKPAEIITTIQKAMRDFKPADVRAVMARFAADPTIAQGLRSVETDLLRIEVAAFNQDENRKDPLPQDMIARLAQAASAEGKISDFSLIGWYSLKVENPAEASVWFRKAIEKEPSGEHAKGLYLALVRQNRQDEAYELALKYKADLEADPVFLMNALSERFANPDTGPITPEAVRAYSGTILATNNPDHAEILAWYAYNSDQFEPALAWFTKSVGWKPAEARVKGLALTFARLGDKPELVKLYRRYADDYPDIWDDIHLAKGKDVRKVRRQKKVGPDFLDGEEVATAEKPARVRRVVVEESVETSDVAPQKVKVRKPSSGYLMHFEAKRFSACIAEMEKMGALTPDQSLIKGWCHLGLNRLAEARADFAVALQGPQRIREDAAYGTALTYLRAKLTDEASSVIALYPLAPKRDVEVRSEIYWQRARSAFDHQQYQATLDALNARIAITPEPVDLTQLRGWAHFKLGHVAEARAIFDRLNMHLDDPAIRRGLTATGAESAQNQR